MKTERSYMGTVYQRPEEGEIADCTCCNYWNGKECKRRKEKEDCFEPKRLLDIRFSQSRKG